MVRALESSTNRRRTNLGRTGDPTRALHFADQRVTRLQKIKSKQSLGISRVGEETNKLRLIEEGIQRS